MIKKSLKNKGIHQENATDNVTQPMKKKINMLEARENDNDDEESENQKAETPAEEEDNITDEKNTATEEILRKRDKDCDLNEISDVNVKNLLKVHTTISSFSTFCNKVKTNK